MFIVWGTTIKYKNVGRVADFCRACRQPRAHRLRRVGSAFHIYYLSIGQGSFEGYDTECETCRLVRDTDIERYAAVSRDPRLGVDELIEDTFPTISSVYAERMAHEARLRAGKLTPKERIDALREPFRLLEPLLERNNKAPDWSQAAKIAGKTTLSLVVVALLFSILDIDAGPTLRAIFTYLLLASLAANYFFLATRSTWFMRYRVRPVFVHSLGPLEPTLEELKRNVGFFKKNRRFKIAKKITAMKLHAWAQEFAALESLRARPR